MITRRSIVPVDMMYGLITEYLEALTDEGERKMFEVQRTELLVTAFSSSRGFATDFPKNHVVKKIEVKSCRFQTKFNDTSISSRIYLVHHFIITESCSFLLPMSSICSLPERRCYAYRSHIAYAFLHKKSTTRNPRKQQR